MVKHIKLVVGLIGTIGLSLGIAMLLVWLIPVRGTMLTVIVAPISTIFLLAGLGLTVWWAYAREEY